MIATELQYPCLGWPQKNAVSCQGACRGMSASGIYPKFKKREVNVQVGNEYVCLLASTVRHKEQRCSRHVATTSEVSGTTLLALEVEKPSESGIACCCQEETRLSRARHS